MMATGPSPTTAPGAGPSVGPAATVDPLRFPLTGSQLIEASAGTGKTWTIAALYVRVVLGHVVEPDGSARLCDDQARHPREILVTTFSRAATRELGDRIRARLVEAAEWFRHAPGPADPGPGPGDDYLRQLRDAIDSQRWPECALRLQRAADAMDEAAVTTIHAWCSRVLREYAFECGSLLVQQHEDPAESALDEAVRDYWRRFVAPLPGPLQAHLPKDWETPASLRSCFKKWPLHLPASSCRLLTPEQVLDAFVTKLVSLKQPWRGAWIPQLRSDLDDACARSLVNGRQIQPRYYESWLKALEDWRDSPSLRLPELNKGWERLTPAGLRQAYKQGSYPLALQPILDAIEKLQDEVRVADPLEPLLRHAVAWIRDRVQQQRTERAQSGLEDILPQLHRALCDEAHGPGLAKRLRQKFPVAFIDEFQDTDPIQYGIFDRVYQVRADNSETTLVLIGDPKQAIYGFRGADIHTYLRARQDCAPRHHVLGVNHRSTEAMVAAVNHLYQQAEARHSEQGAFRLAIGGDAVRFVPVKAAGHSETLVVNRATPKALTLWWGGTDGGAMSREACKARMSAVLAKEIAGLLEGARTGCTGFQRGAHFQPLQPSDMAVLVKDRHEAAEVRAALAARGVASVYMSERDSVYQTQAAADLELWLEACLDPDDGRRLRAALATATLGLSWEEIVRVQDDDRELDHRVEQFRRYRTLWQRQGLLPAVRHLMQDFKVPASLLAAPDGDGERTLTDLLHLAELLQAESGTVEGEAGLLRLLARQRARGDTPTDDENPAILRLESDADRVKVMTIFKSKGLEYPLVFVPFASLVRKRDDKQPFLTLPDSQGQTTLHFQPGSAEFDRAEEERLCEALRQFYVALTRARHATWLGLGYVNDFHRSASGNLLGLAENASSRDCWQTLEALQEGCDHIGVVEVQDPSTARSPTRTAAPAVAPVHVGAGAGMRPALTLDRAAVTQPWWIASYSALASDAGGGTPAQRAPEAPDSGREERLRDSTGDATARAGAPLPGLHGFPRGAEAGSFLHDLLEWAVRAGLRTLASDRPRLRDEVARRCARRGWETWIDPLTNWMTGLPERTLPMGPGGETMRLGDLVRPIPEMEFWLPVGGMKATALDALVCQHTLGGAQRPALAERQVQGMLKGFVDLVFEHEGRYYVADYKSNRLGDDDTAYGPDALCRAVLDHRYDLQYVLYLVALHRLLRARLPGYCYDTHVGGAVYLFLRGLEAPGAGVHFERPPAALVDAIDRLLAGSASTATAMVTASASAGAQP